MLAVLSLVLAVPVVVPSTLLFMGAALPSSWSISISPAAVHGLAGWVLLVSSNIKAFQLYQRQTRAAPI